jgi:hypothetical protein
VTWPSGHHGRRRGCGWRCPTPAAGAALAAAGVTLLGGPRELRTGWVVEVADPWGNVIGLTDYRNAPERARRADGRPGRA